MPRYPIVMEVKEIRAELPPPCPIHKAGDQMTISNGCLDGRLCLPVAAQQMARLYALANGLPAKDLTIYNCPDNGKVVFEIRRDSTKWWKEPLSPLTEAEVRPGT